MEVGGSGWMVLDCYDGVIVYCPFEVFLQTHILYTLVDFRVAVGEVSNADGEGRDSGGGTGIDGFNIHNFFLNSKYFLLLTCKSNIENIEDLHDKNIVFYFFSVLSHYQSPPLSLVIIISVTVPCPLVIRIKGIV